ncbi:DNA polymerase III subunit delta' [Desulfosoma sp.]
MTVSEGFSGQPHAQRVLLRMIHGGKLPHAVLFTGMPGVGKKALALECAKAVNCLESPPKAVVGGSLPDNTARNASSMACQRCTACLKIARGVHPDVLVIAKDGASIKLAQIRALKERCRVHPYEARRRVILIEDSQDLTEEASNALLKILEEPPTSNLFFLLAPEPYSLLPTIVSRCCHIRCRPLDDAIVASALQAEFSVDAETAARLARLSFGSLEKARGWVRENRLHRMEAVMARLERLLKSPMIDFFRDVTQWVKETEDLEQDLECIKFSVREALVHHVERGRGHAAEGRTVSAPWDQADLKKLLHVLDVLETAEQHHRAHVSKQLLLEAVCLKIKDVVYGQGHRYPFPRGRKNLSF